MFSCEMLMVSAECKATGMRTSTSGSEVMVLRWCVDFTLWNGKELLLQVKEVGHPGGAQRESPLLHIKRSQLGCWDGLVIWSG